jgi:hypothetical protein
MEIQISNTYLIKTTFSFTTLFGVSTILLVGRSTFSMLLILSRFFHPAGDISPFLSINADGVRLAEAGAEIGVDDVKGEDFRVG